MGTYITPIDYTTVSTMLDVVLHDISKYRIDIEGEPKTDYEKCLNQHRITYNNIKNRYRMTK